MKISSRQLPIFFTWMVLSFFLFGTEARYGIDKGLINKNYVVIICIFIMLLIFRWKIKVFNFWLCTLFSIVAILVDCWLGDMNSTFIRVTINIPIILLIFDYNKINVNYNLVIQKALKAYNFLTIVLLAIYFIDCFTNGLIMRWYAQNVAPNIAEWISESMGVFQYRYSSILGQSLVTCQTFFIFFFLNLAYGHRTKEYLLNRYLIYVIGILGVLSTASKTGLILLSVVLAYTLITEKGLGLKGVLFLVIIPTLIYSGAFSLIVERLFNSKTITTGRIENYLIALDAGLVKIRMIGGTGSDLIKVYGTVMGAFRAQIINEFPLVSLLLQYGVVYVILYCFVVFISPFVEIFKTKDKYCCLCLVVLFIEVNTYNLIITYMDAVFLYAFAVVMLIFISKLPDKAQNVNIRKEWNG